MNYGGILRLERRLSLTDVLLPHSQKHFNQAPFFPLFADIWKNLHWKTKFFVTHDYFDALRRTRSINRFNMESVREKKNLRYNLSPRHGSRSRTDKGFGRGRRNRTAIPNYSFFTLSRLIYSSSNLSPPLPSVPTYFRGLTPNKGTEKSSYASSQTDERGSKISSFIHARIMDSPKDYPSRRAKNDWLRISDLAYFAVRN